MIHHYNKLTSDSIGLITKAVFSLVFAFSIVGLVHAQQTNSYKSETNLSQPVDTQPIKTQDPENLVIFYQGINLDQNEFLESLLFQLKSERPQYHYQLVNIAQLSKNAINAYYNQATHCAVTIGLETTQKILSLRNPVKTFALSLSRLQLDKLNQTYQRLNIEVSGIYKEQSFARQIALAQALEPELKQVGSLFGQADKYYLPEFQQTANEKGFQLNFQILQMANSGESYLTRVVDNNGYFVLLNNSQIYQKSKLANLVLAASHHQIKLIGNLFESSQLGAIASVYTPTNELLKEASKDISAYCQNNPTAQSAKISPHYAKGFSVMVNHPMAENFGISELNIYDLTNKIATMEKDKRNQHE